MEAVKSVNSNREERPYGWKEKIDESTARIGISPQKNTSIGAKAQELDQDGLRAHPGIIKESVKVISGKIKYSYRTENNNVSYVLYSSGMKFDSVGPNNSGYYHMLENISENLETVLEITAVKKPPAEITEIERE